MGTLANQRHERFAQALAEGKSATKAYTIAGYRQDRHHAARLATNGHIHSAKASFGLR
jgi:phage terminase small subunit